MIFITYVRNFHEAQTAKSLSINEVIIGSKELSRFEEITCDEAITLASKCRELGLKCVFEWDILMTESIFKSKIHLINKVINSNVFDCIRVQDAGALNYILENSKCQIQFISETGNHNLTGLKAWKKIIGDRLDRIALSVEIQKNTLINYKKELDCEIEFLLFGRILLFYTPRNLLSSMLSEDDEKRSKEVITALGESEESPHKGFPLIENSHGTFMFHIKNHCIATEITDIKDSCVWRIDLRFNHEFEFLAQVLELAAGQLDFKLFKEKYPTDLIKGFFNINKSDVLFKKLKNTRLQREDDSYIGEVVEFKKSDFLIIKTYNEFTPTKDCRIKFITPEGKELSAPLIFLKDASLNDVASISKGRLMAMNYMSGVWVKSKVYLEN